MGKSSKAAAVVEWSEPESRRQAVCAADGRAGEVTQAPWRSTENYDCIPDNWTFELFILYEFDFVWLRL